MQDSLQTSQGYLFIFFLLLFFLFFCSLAEIYWDKSNWRGIAGCARVEGDEEEEGVDDLEDEFNFVGRRRDTQDMQYIAEGMLQGHMTYGRAGDADMLPQVVNTMPAVPLLTNGQMVFNHILCFFFFFFMKLTSLLTRSSWLWLLQVDDIPPEHHALVPSFLGGGGKRIHPLPFSDPALPGKFSFSHPSSPLDSQHP